MKKLNNSGSFENRMAVERGHKLFKLWNLMLGLCILYIFQVDELWSQSTVSTTSINANDSVYWSDRIYVKVKDSYSINLLYPNGGSLPPEVQNIISQYNVTSIEQPFAISGDLRLSKIYRVFFSNGNDRQNVIQAFSSLPYIEYAERIPIMKTFTCTTESSNYWSNPTNSYHQNLVQYCNAWSVIGTINPSLSNITVAVVDNECDINHPDLLGVVVTTTDVVNGGTIVTVNNSAWNHGTHVTGLVAAVKNNSLGVVGLGNGLSIMFIKAANTSGSPNIIVGGYTGILWAAVNGAKVINCSWGGFGYSISEEEVVEWCISQKNVIIVAAAGNCNVYQRTFPASYPNVYAVGSTGNTDNKSSFSNYGDWVDITAPGENIYSTINRAVNLSNPYDYLSGTSMAAPQVSALCGLVWAINPSYSNFQVLNIISSTADPVTGFTSGNVAGRINAFKAVSASSNTSVGYVNFNMSSPRICMNNTISFNDLSYSPNPISAWKWSFMSPNNTIISTLQNPVITFNTAGMYTVNLTYTTTSGQVYSNYGHLQIPVVGVNNFTTTSSGNFCKGGDVEICVDINGFNYLSFNFNVNGTNTSYGASQYLWPYLGVTKICTVLPAPTNTNNLNVSITSVTTSATSTLLTCPLNLSINVPLVDCCKNLINNGDFEVGANPVGYASFTTSLTPACSSPGGFMINPYPNPPFSPRGNFYLRTDLPGDPTYGNICATVPVSGNNTSQVFLVYSNTISVIGGVDYILSFVNNTTDFLYAGYPWSTPLCGVGGAFWGSQYIGNVGPAKFRISILDPSNTPVFTQTYIPHTQDYPSQWTQFKKDFTGTNTFSTSGVYSIKIEQIDNFHSNGFDFSWDDISFRAINNNTLSITATPTMGCINSSVTLFANYSSNASPFTYTWTSSGGGTLPNSNPISTILTSTNNTLTVSVMDANLCINTASISIPAVQCCTNCPNTFTGGVVSGGNLNNNIYCITGNIFINGNVTINDCELKIAPNVSIVVMPNAQLNIYGSHLYSCSDMWSGILVQNNGTLNISSGKTHPSSLIEDAIIAVEAVGNGTATSNTQLRISNSTFNRNYIDIYLHDYQRNISTYPFYITGNVFTCRDIPFVPNSLAWPSTAAVSASVIPASPLQTPYIDNAVYSPTNAAAFLKFPYAGQKSFIGIKLQNVGYTSGTFTIGGLTFRELQIGNGTSMNIIDNKVYGIDAFNANFTSYNNVYQNMVRIGKGGSSGSVGIQARGILLSAGALGNRIRVIPTNTITGNGNNKFFDCSTSISVTDYTDIELLFNDIRSTQVNTAPVSIINHTGLNGISCSTGKYILADINNNKLYNIENGIVFNATKVLTNLFPVNYQQISGQLNINNNVIQPHLPGYSISTQYVSNGIYAASILLSASQYSVIGTTSVSIIGNKLSDVWRGVYAANWYKKDVRVQNNCITLRNDSYGSVQYGIESANNIPQNNFGVMIYNNNVTGPASASAKMKGIWVSLATQNAVRCNVVSSVANGIEFSGTSAPCQFLGNVMQNCSNAGYVLSNNAIIGPQGNINMPSDNQWFTSSIQTLCDGSTASFSPLYVRNVSSYFPASNVAINGGVPYSLGTSLFISSGPYIVCSPVNPCGTNIPPTPIVIPIPPPFNNPHIPTLEKIAQNQIPAFIDTATSRFINQNHLFRTLLATPSLTNSSVILQQFALQNQMNMSTKELFQQTETDIAQGNFTSASSKLALINPQNIAESNHKTFYEIYLNYLQGNMSAGDSAQLWNIANACPYRDGAVVYQARALYNVLNNNIQVFEDNCNTNVNSREVQNKSDGMIDEEIRIYPNPNDGNFVIEMSKEKEGVLQIEVSDVSGKVVYQTKRVLQNGKVEIKLEVTSGVYLISITDLETKRKKVEKMLVK